MSLVEIKKEMEEKLRNDVQNFQRNFQKISLHMGNKEKLFLEKMCRYIDTGIDLKVIKKFFIDFNVDLIIKQNNSKDKEKAVEVFEEIKRCLLLTDVLVDEEQINFLDRFVNEIIKITDVVVKSEWYQQLFMFLLSSTMKLT